MISFGSLCAPSAHIRHDTVASRNYCIRTMILTPDLNEYFRSTEIPQSGPVLPDINRHGIRIPSPSRSALQICRYMCSRRSDPQSGSFLLIFNNYRLLHHAAAESDQHMWIFFLNSEYPESSVDFVICIFTHRAGIVNNKIRFLRIRLHITDALLRYRQASESRAFIWQPKVVT